MRKLTIFKSLLVAAGLCVGASAWAQKSTWTYSATDASNTYGAEFDGSKAGLVKVQLGATSEAEAWSTYVYGNYTRGVAHSTHVATLSTEEGQTAVPVSGNFIIVKPTVDIVFSVDGYSSDNIYVYLVSSETPSTNTKINGQYRVKNNWTCNAGTLKAGVTYYIYGDNNNTGFRGFTAKSIELVNLETEITSAQALYDNVSYLEGKVTLNSAITTATNISTNNELSASDYISARKTLLEKEGEFLATNGNTDFIVSSSEYVYCGRQIKSVDGIVMTLGGKEGTDTWSVGSYSFTGTITGNSYTHNIRTASSATNNGGRCNGNPTVAKLPNQGTYFVFTPSYPGRLTVAMLFCGSRNMYFVDSEKNVIDLYNPASNTREERSYTVESGKTYYLWQDNNANAYLQGYHFDAIKNQSATIGSTGWTTFASPYALDLSGMTASEGTVTAYYARSVGSNSVTMTSTEKSDVIAGEGLMLNGTAGATITIPVVASGTAISGNKLVGCTTSTDLVKNASYYVLVNEGGKAVFQSLENNDATIPAGKAYLDAGKAAARLSIVFEDETTGVTDVRSKTADVRNEFYNLNGQRIQNPTKGLYIVNGKKVVVK